MVAINGTFDELDIVWRANSPELHKLRKLVVREIMSNKGLSACYGFRRREIQQMVKNIHGKMLLKYSITISMLWGGSLNGEEAKLGLEINDQLEEFVGLMGEPNLSDIFPMLRPFDLQGIESKTKRHLSWFYGFLELVIEQ
ncbi:hypothetical protein Golob_000976 [Gossypium lobatum]|uniref:Uncharacterized protein n=1 Tax=Gossypium lobatum TaxID=34289 RepID=A0A7J8NA28_9ROSI|nr:hypothetical protein [Gossypium lobatum]